MRKFIIIILLLVFIVPAFSVDEGVWDAMKNKQVRLVKRDGSEVNGKLISHNNVRVNIIKQDGRVVAVAKMDVENVYLLGRGTVTRTIETTEFGPSYFAVNPLGLLQFGPMVEYAFKINKRAYASLNLRLSGIGLLYQAIITNGFEDYLAPWSFALGIKSTGLLPSQTSNNALYFGGYFELGFNWDAGDLGTSYEWESRFGTLAAASNIGYRWRFPSGFFINLGLFAGVAFEIWDTWWYVYAPGYEYEGTKEIVFFGFLEFSMGWEKKLNQ